MIWDDDMMIWYDMRLYDITTWRYYMIWSSDRMIWGYKTMMMIWDEMIIRYEMTWRYDMIWWEGRRRYVDERKRRLYAKYAFQIDDGVQLGRRRDRRGRLDAMILLRRPSCEAVDRCRLSIMAMTSRCFRWKAVFMKRRRDITSMMAGYGRIDGGMRLTAEMRDVEE